MTKRRSTEKSAEFASALKDRSTLPKKKLKELMREGPAVGEDEDLRSTTFVNFQLQCNENQGVTKTDD